MSERFPTKTRFGELSYVNQNSGCFSIILIILIFAVIGYCIVTMGN